MSMIVDTYRKKLNQRNNLLEVPNLLAFDEQFHGLFQELRKIKEIKSFEAFPLSKNGTLIKVYISSTAAYIETNFLSRIYGSIRSMAFKNIVFKWSYRSDLVEIKITKP